MKSMSVKVWLLRNRITQGQIARDLNVTRTTVYAAINNRGKNSRVTRWLLDHGCPESFLDLPEKKAA